jgi:hypothetical protein
MRVTAAPDLRAAADVNQRQRAENRVVHGVVRHMHNGHGGVVERVAPSREALVSVGVEVVTVKKMAEFRFGSWNGGSTRSRGIAAGDCPAR